MYSNTIRSIALGSFDGIHLGHRELIDRVDMLVVIERNGGFLTPGHKRAQFAEKPCTFYYFEKIKGLSPAAFVAKLTEDFPALKKIVVGYDFAFGKEKSGNAETLRELFRGEVVVIDQVSYQGTPVHSRAIKAFFVEGNIAKVNTLLGREHTIEGPVAPGQGLGKKELVPTINIQPVHYLLPHEGVYATRTKIDKHWHNSVSFIGHRVTTDGSYAVESHILDTEIGDVTGDVAIAFVDFIRPNQKFDQLDALKEQIQKDIQAAKKIVG